MLPEDIACNKRNLYPGNVYDDIAHSNELCGEDLKIDYRDEEVRIEVFKNLLLGNQDDNIPQNKVLASTENSNILLYISGHGGEGFLKFQDVEEIGSLEFAEIIDRMWRKSRYNKILLLLDTCQAGSMFEHIKSPNFVGISSSKIGENSWSYKYDEDLGVSLADRFTGTIVAELDKGLKDNTQTVKTLADSLLYENLNSHSTLHTAGNENIEHTPIKEFLTPNHVYSTPSIISSIPTQEF